VTIETATFINGLNAANPGSTDAKSEGDDHIRLVKATVKATFPNVTGAVTATHTALNSAAGVGSGTFPSVPVTGVTKVTVTPGNVSALGSLASSAVVIDNFSGVGNVSQIGFGYTAAGVNVNATAAIALVETNNSGNGAGDLVFATRSVTTDTAPTERVRIATDGTVTIPGTLVASLPWTSVAGRPTNVSAFTNDAGYLTSAGTVTWAAVTGKPTAVSYFTNDSGYQTTAGTVTNLSGGSVAATTISASGAITTLGAFTATGLVYGGAGGSGLGRITTTTTTGSPAGTAQGDWTLVY
jgi:hypothetical protein